MVRGEEIKKIEPIMFLRSLDVCFGFQDHTRSFKPNMMISEVVHVSMNDSTLLFRMKLEELK